MREVVIDAKNLETELKKALKEPSIVKLSPKQKKLWSNLWKETVLYKYPRCYDSKKQYEEWLGHEQICHTTAFRKNICEDCTVSYKNSMITAKKCCNPASYVKD